MANFTEQAIKTSFIKLLNSCPLGKITVKNIVEECGINRNSFYYHFQDIPALVESIIIEQTDRLIQAYPTLSSLDECFTVAFTYVLNNKKAISNIYNSINKDVFIQAALKLCESIVTNYVNTVFPDEPISETDSQVLIRFIKCQLFGLIIEWINSGMPEDAMVSMQRILELCSDVPRLIIDNSKNNPQ